MDIRLLGPLEALADDGSPLPVSAPMPRATLAALALAEGRAVPVAELARQLWGDRPPAGARATVRGHVARLRRVLPPGRLHTERPGGYRLALAPEETDLGRFNAAVLRARGLAAAAPADAVAVLAGALSLWRGTPLDGERDTPLREQARTRLGELRLAVLEDWFALRLSLGERGALGEELADAARAHPGRDRLAHLARVARASAGPAAAAPFDAPGPPDNPGKMPTGPRAGSAAFGDPAARPGPDASATPAGPRAASAGAAPEAAGPPGDPGAQIGPNIVPALAASPHTAAEAPGSDGVCGVPTAPGAGGVAPSPGAPALAPAGPGRGASVGCGALAASAASGDPAAAAFPPAVATFVARATELARLRGWLSGALGAPDAPPVCLIDGPGGVGKSTLAVRAAREVADRFPDGLLYVDLRGADPRNPPLEVGEARRLLLASLGTTGKEIPQEPTAAAAFYQDRLHGRRVLLLLDNALSAGQVEALLPADPGSAAIVTSRSALTSMRRGHHLHLATLTTAEATAFVRAVIGGAADRGSQQDWEQLVALCGHLPLALRIVATRMAARPDWRVADWNALLRDERGRMDQLTADDLDLRASLLVSIDQLAASPDPADRLAVGIFPLLGAAAVVTYGPGPVAALTGCTPRQAGAALDRLTDARITSSPRPGAYTLHDLVRSAAAWQAARLPARRIRERLAELARWYLGSLYRVNTPLALAERFRKRYQRGADRYPQGRLFTSVAESLPWADEALDDVLSLAHQLSAPEYDLGGELSGGPLSAFALESVRALESYFGMRLSWTAQCRLCEIVLEAGRRTGDAFAQAVALGQLGKAAGQRGEGLAGADMLRRGIALFRSLGEHEEAVSLTMTLVPCLGSTGQLAEAVEVSEAALAEAREAGMADLEVQIINNLGRCHVFLGNHDTAYRLLRANYDRTALPYEKCIAAGVLAEYHLEIGEFEQAARWADRGLSHAAEQPFDPFVMAQHRTWLAAALRGLGREDRARAEETQAQAVLEELNSRENSHLRVSIEQRYATT